jgi:osmotically-inducible protein OsmY
MADNDRYSRDEQPGYERGRQWNRADRRDDDFGQNRLDDRNGYGMGSAYGSGQSRGLYGDSYGNYGGGGGDYDMPRYSREQEDRAFGQPRGPRPSPRGGTYAYGAEDSGRGYHRQYDPYLDRNHGYESRPFNPYRGEYGGSDYGPSYENRTRGQGRPGGDGRRGFWDKATDEVASWMGDHDALQRRMQDGRGSHQGKGPKGYRRSDERIRDEVSDRLSDDHWLDASDIEVKVENGEVTLSGTVTERDSKRRAERLAESASGVSDVQNNIKVRQGASTGSGETSGLGVNTTLDDQARGRA